MTDKNNPSYSPHYPPPYKSNGYESSDSSNSSDEGQTAPPNRPQHNPQQQNLQYPQQQYPQQQQQPYPYQQWQNPNQPYPTQQYGYPAPYGAGPSTYGTYAYPPGNTANATANPPDTATSCLKIFCVGYCIYYIVCCVLPIIIAPLAGVGGASSSSYRSSRY